MGKQSSENVSCAESCDGTSCDWAEEGYPFPSFFSRGCGQRVPKSLFRSFSTAFKALSGVRALSIARESCYPPDDARMLIQSWTFLHKSDFEVAWDDPLDVLAYVAEALRDATVKAIPAFEKLEEEFGGAACVVAEHRGLWATSYHKLVIEMALMNVGLLAWKFGLPGVSDLDRELWMWTLHHGTADYRDESLRFTAREFRKVLDDFEVDDASDTLDSLPMRLVDANSHVRLTVCLVQEMFRVWKQRYPGDTAYKKAGSEADEFLTLLQQGVPSRPTYQRNCLWLKWKREEKLTPAKIRDRWNAMPNCDRATTCPRAPGKIATGTRGRDLVKKALKAAESERKS